MRILEITKSNLRKKLLSYYFSNPEAEHYLREIASILEVDPGNLSKELVRLENEGIFISRERGRIKLYNLNKEYPLFQEIKSIVFKTIGIEGLLKKEFQNIPSIQIGFIYGSFARDKAKADSDIDIFVIGRPNEQKLNRGISLLEKQLGREINYILWSKNEVIQKTREKNSFLAEIFNEKKIFLKGNDKKLQKLLRTKKIAEN